MKVLNIPAHVTFDESTGKADCAICGIGMTAPSSFGGIPRSNMLASFLVQHAVHSRAGVASGLTAKGDPTKAAREFVWGDQ